jgi:ABC-type dipeptide/oligopeptide/nickel transport system permease component
LEITLRGYSVWRLGVVLGYFFKASFGEAGLTGDLGRMEKGELDSFLQLYRQGLLSGSALGLVSTFSIAKYLRRLFLTKINRQR